MPGQNTRIELLPPIVSDKIAAGEVVERPASVVKELIENSLDAGATKIDLVIEDAGFALIQISDNGAGIHPKDLDKCTLRHATSKIRTVDDLFSIGTLGFRGEALASIASVSKVTIESCQNDDAEGARIQIRDGVPSDPMPAPRRKGATIIVRDLFYNTPARKKFVGKPRAERMALLRYVEQLVIPFPSVHFTVVVDGKRVIEAPQVQSPKERIAQVAGTKFAKGLIECSAERDGMNATLYISEPQNATARPRFQYLYVNLRRVDNDSVTYGVREGFSQFISSQYRPAWFCLLEVNPAMVDVNIHPTKQRVKFEEEREMFRFMYGMVRTGVSNALVAPDQSLPTGMPSSNSLPTAKIGGESVAYLHETAAPLRNPMAPQVKPEDAVQTSLSFLSIQKAPGPEEKVIQMPVENQQETGSIGEEPWDLIPCYQVHRMYVLAQLKNGILLIDQHAAHERVLYEQALADLEAGKSDSQRMLFPLVIEFSQAEKSVVLSGRDYFNALGFDIQDFGGNSISVSGIPAAGFSKQTSVERAVREMVENLLGEKDQEVLSQPQRRFAAAFACGAAIKAGQELKQEEMHSLLNALFAAKSPFICPHGRPTSIRISLDELSRRFLRS